MYRYHKSYFEKLFDILNYTILMLLTILFLYPFWQTLVISFSKATFVMTLGLKFYPQGGVVLESYKLVFKNDLIYTGYANTLFRVIIATILTVFVTYFGAYSLSKKKIPYRNSITVFILIPMFFSGGLIPSYLLIHSLGLIDSRWALILPGLASTWNLIIARNFITTIPESLEESAFIDGAHPLIVLFKIMIPLSMPIIAVIALWTAVSHWNSWFDAMIYLNSREKMVLQQILRRLLIENDVTLESLKSRIMSHTREEIIPETLKAATIMVTIIPIILFYPFLQKYFVKGMFIGSLKG